AAEHESLAAAARTMFANHAPAAMTRRTGRLQRKEPACLHDPPATAAVGAFFRPRTGLRARAAARFAHEVPLELDSLRYAGGRLAEFQHDLTLDVGTLAHAPPAAEQVAKQPLAEYVPKGLEDVAHVAEVRRLSALKPREPEAV